MAEGIPDGKRMKVSIAFMPAQFDYINRFAGEEGISFAEVVRRLVHIGYKHGEEARGD